MALRPGMPTLTMPIATSPSSSTAGPRVPKVTAFAHDKHGEQSKEGELILGEGAGLVHAQSAHAGRVFRPRHSADE